MMLKNLKASISSKGTQVPLRARIRALFATALLVLASVGLPIALAQPASAATRLGGVSVSGACFNQWPGYYKVALISNNVFGWKCQFNSSSGPVYFGVNLTQQCVVQYGSNAVAQYTNYNDPYSWGCYR